MSPYQTVNVITKEMFDNIMPQDIQVDANQKVPPPPPPPQQGEKANFYFLLTLKIRCSVRFLF